MIQQICVAGAGTMGSGIALAVAQHGYSVTLFDTNESVIARARDSITKNLKFLVDKQKITAVEQQQIFDGINFTTSIGDCSADLVIEAIIEKMPAKHELFVKLASINSAETIFASNTSSLSITSLQNGIAHPERVAGLHFFNPAHIMKLVEVVQGDQTSNETIVALTQFCENLNKTPVVCKDAPGFIVNRVARHYYLEAMRLLQMKVATFEDIDRIMEASGFKMGPFKLMDLIGMDINLAVSQSLYEAFNNEPRLEPSPLQIEKVSKGELGKKSGKGFYSYPSPTR